LGALSGFALPASLPTMAQAGCCESCDVEG
jgi:hypothetical protein